VGEKLTTPEIRQALAEAADKVSISIGGVYRHYKNPDNKYTVLGLFIIEATNGVGVLYKANYGDLDGIQFARPVEASWRKYQQKMER
jgi:hypothetical protein